MSNGILKPVDVPWMVSPSVSNIKLVTVEEEHSEVLLDAARLTEDVYDELENIRVNLRFVGGLWVHASPAFGDTETIPPELYDMTFAYGDCSLSTEERRQLWSSSGRCPSPRIFIVDQSKWLKESGAYRFNLTHFVIKGRDLWVEILAESFEWRYAPEEALGAHYESTDL